MDLESDGLICLAEGHFKTGQQSGCGMVLLVALIQTHCKKTSKWSRERQENVQFGKQKNTQKFKAAEKGGC